MMVIFFLILLYSNNVSLVVVQKYILEKNICNMVAHSVRVARVLILLTIGKRLRASIWIRHLPPLLRWRRWGVRDPPPSFPPWEARFLSLSIYFCSGKSISLGLLVRVPRGRRQRREVGEAVARRVVGDDVAPTNKQIARRPYETIHAYTNRMGKRSRASLYVEPAWAAGVGESRQASEQSMCVYMNHAPWQQHPKHAVTNGSCSTTGTLYVHRDSL